MKLIKNLHELNAFVQDNCHEISGYVAPEDHDALPSYSVQNMQHECGNLIAHYRKEERDNYVPHYHGYGLLSRVLNLTQCAGAQFSPKLFTKMGATKEEAARMIENPWY